MWLQYMNIVNSLWSQINIHLYLRICGNEDAKYCIHKTKVVYGSIVTKDERKWINVSWCLISPVVFYMTQGHNKIQKLGLYSIFACYTELSATVGRYECWHCYFVTEICRDFSEVCDVMLANTWWIMNYILRLI